jgi:hypothetical protein
MNRPIGVTLIAILYVIVGVILVLGGLSLVALTDLLGSGYGSDMIPGLSGIPYMDLILAYGGFVALFFVIVAIIGFIMAWGLLRGKGWARTLAIAFSGLFLVLNLLSLSSGLSLNLIMIAISAAIIYYLLFTPPAKAFFGRGRGVAYQPYATYPTTQAPAAPLPPPPPQEVAQKACPRCGQPLTWIDQYQRWYCYNCQQYA